MNKVTLIILFDKSHLFAHKFFQVLIFNIRNSIYRVFLSNINQTKNTCIYKIKAGLDLKKKIIFIDYLQYSGKVDSI